MGCASGSPLLSFTPPTNGPRYHAHFQLVSRSSPLAEPHGFTVACWRASKRRVLGEFRRASRIDWHPADTPAKVGAQHRGVLERSAQNEPTAPPAGVKKFTGKIYTSTPYIIGKIVSRLEMDSRWAVARAVRALVAERDALKEKLQGSSVARSE